MRLHLVKKALPAIFIAATWWTGACSSDQQETEEPVNSQGNQENANQGEAEAGNASENAIASSSEAEGNSNSAADASAAAEPPPEPAPPPAPEAPAPAPAPLALAPPPSPAAAPAAAGDDIVPKPNRFVRYVQTGSAVVRSEPNDGAPTVVTLAKGDHILVSEENGWGKIASGKFIKLSELSHKAVPRDRVAPAWN